MNYLVINEEKKIISYKCQSYKISQSELFLLRYFLQEKGRELTKTELLKVGWPSKVVSLCSLPVAINHLRNIFLSTICKNPIITIDGIGYEFNEKHYYMITFESTNKKKKKFYY